MDRLKKKEVISLQLVEDFPSMLDFPALLQNQCSQLITLSGARDRTKGHFMACPKPWVMGHCPCKRSTSYQTPCQHREEAEGSAAEGSGGGNYLLQKWPGTSWAEVILLFLQFPWMLESLDAPQLLQLSCVAGSMCFRLLVGSSYTWPPQHPLLIQVMLGVLGTVHLWTFCVVGVIERSWWVVLNNEFI